VKQSQAAAANNIEALLFEEFGLPTMLYCLLLS
jgi:hypothetical protein